MPNPMLTKTGLRIFGTVRPKGKFPLRQTEGYLKRGKILKPGIDNVAVYFRRARPNDFGIRQFIFYNLPQLVFVNPKIQFNTFKEQKPGTIEFYLTGGERIQVDVEGMTRKEICEVVVKIAEKSPEQIEADKKPTNVNPSNPKYLMNPCNFGFPEFGQRKCICVIPGQLPCSRYMKHWPKEMKEFRAKTRLIGTGRKVDKKFLDLEYL